MPITIPTSTQASLIGESKAKIETILKALPSEEQSRLNFVMSRLYDSPAVGPCETATVIGEDTNLSALLIRVANTVHDGAGIPVMNVEAATVRLGADRTKSLAIANYVIDLLHQATDSTIDFNEFLQLSLVRGSLARAIAMNCDRRIAGKAFLVGMMQSIGVPLLARHYRKKYTSLIERSRGCLQRLAILEWQSFNFNHIHVALSILDRWNTPADVKSAVARHHTNPPMGPNVDTALRLWQIAYFVSAVTFRAELRNAFKDAFLARMLNASFGNSGVSTPRLFDQAVAEYEDIAGLFESWLTADVGVAELLRSANVLLENEAASQADSDNLLSGIGARNEAPRPLRDIGFRSSSEAVKPL